MNSSFQNNLTSVRFQSFQHNQAVELGYESLFAEKRVLVISIPNIFGTRSPYQLRNFNAELTSFHSMGIDEVYVVSSHTAIVAPWAQAHSLMLGLYDRGQFVKLVAEHFGIDKSEKLLKSTWQYIILVKNGEPEKFWHNPVKENIKLEILRNPQYDFRRLSPDTVKAYLSDCVL